MKTSSFLKIRFLLGLLWALILFSPVAAQAQTRPEGMTEMEVTSTPVNSDIEMADRLRQDGKIYVVVAVFLIIMAGVVFYLVRLDRKVSALEKEFGKDLR